MQKTLRIAEKRYITENNFADKVFFIWYNAEYINNIGD